MAEEPADLVVFDGSGAAIPPVATDRRILVTSGVQDVAPGSTPTASSSPTS